MKSRATQRGDGTVRLLLTLALLVGSFYWLASDYLPAEAHELQAVVELAATSPSAKATLAESLKEAPNPNRSELRAIRGKVNEILVTEQARAVTGDQTLQSPSEREAAQAQEREAQAAALAGKAWKEMSWAELLQHLVHQHWKTVLVVCVLWMAVLVGRREFLRAANGQ